MMKNSKKFLGCSAFCLQKDSAFLVGRNLDVVFSDGYVLTNHRGVKKRSIVADALCPAQWKSKFGSITFNLLCKGFPMGGMNECGLVVEHLWMPGTVYPERLGRETLLEFEWMQYMLDNCSSVGEVLSLAEKVTIAKDRVEMHYLVADTYGKSALIEFQEGEPAVYSDLHFPIRVVTNDWYETSLRYLSRLRERSDAYRPTAPMASLDRFVRLAHEIEQFAEPDDKSMNEKAMELLDSVLDETLLSVVYNPVYGIITYKTNSNSAQRRLNLADFSFSSSSDPLMLDIHKDTGAITPFDRHIMNRCTADTIVAGEEFLRLDAYRNRIFSFSCDAGTAGG